MIMKRRAFISNLALESLALSAVTPVWAMGEEKNGKDYGTASVSPTVVDKTSLEIAVLLGNKFIQSNPQIYYPKTKEEKFYPWAYPTGVALWSLCQLFDISSDPAYLDFVQQSFDYYINTGKVTVGIESMNHEGSMGYALAELNEHRPESRYVELIKTITDFYEHEQPRLYDGSFCANLTGSPPELRRTWIDALFIVCPLLAKSSELLNEPQRYDDVLKQFFNYTVRLQDPEIKLFYQGWGWGINRTTHSPGFWSRGNGWVLMAMTEVLNTIPSNHPGWETLCEIYQDLAAAILKEQDSSGRWHQLLTLRDSFEETSGTAMFIYSFVHGYIKGLLTDEFKKSALRGFEGLKQKIDIKGNIYGTCIGTGTQDTLEDYYKRETPVNDSHGIGPVILAALAVSSLNR